MRCKFCGSKAIYPYKNHEQAGAGRVIAGAIIAGPVGAVVGLAGKNVKGYRCSACGMFSEQPMNAAEEMSVNSAVYSAQNGNTLSYERYQEKYANLEFVPMRQAVKQASALMLDDDYDEDVEALPEAEPMDESVKHSYSPNQYAVGSPVFITNVTIKDDNGTDVLWLDVSNISGKTLRSVYLSITVYDDVGDQISASTFAFQGLSSATGEQLPQAKPFNLNTNVAYKVNVVCEKAAFTDDTVWRKEENPTIYSVPEKTELVPESFAQHKYLCVLLAKKGALRVGQKLYYPVVEETHRLCVCGNPAVNGSKCLACGLSEADLQEVMDYDVLVQCRKDVIVKTARERTEALHRFIEQSREDTYQTALQLMEEESYAEALQLLESVAGHKNAEILIEKCKEKVEVFQKNKTYYLGMMFADDSEQSVENYAQAIAEFEKIPGWKDADEQIAICQKKIEELKAKEKADRLERERQEEVAKIEAAARAKRNKIIAIIVGAAICAVIAFVIVLNMVIIPNGKYDAAVALMNTGKYTEAISAFEALGGYKDSETKIKQCEAAMKAEKDKEYAAQMDSKYNTALALMDAGKYSEAISAFKALNGYKESNTKISQCEAAMKAEKDKEYAAQMDSKYNAALALMNAGKHTEAIVAFEALGGYKDSENKISACYEAILGPQYDKAVVLMRAGKYAQAGMGFYALGDFKDAAQQCKIAWGQAAVQKTLAAGSQHTVGVKTDGTVVATGANEVGQCNVSEWRNIIAISSGGWNTVGLKADGTVVATGHNAYGKNNVGTWTDIVAISAGGTHTVGLKADGTVVAVGDNKYGQIDVGTWTDIVAVSAGTSYTVGLKADGTVVATGYNDWGQQNNIGTWTDIVAISAGYAHTVGVKADGTVVATGSNLLCECDVSNMKNIIAIYADTSMTIGIKAGGDIALVGGVLETDEQDLPSWKNLVDISSGYHYVGLKADGTVVATGDNEHGQCNVSGWQNIKCPAG